MSEGKKQKKSTRAKTKFKMAKRIEKKWFWLLGGLMFALGLLLVLFLMGEEKRTTKKVAEGLIGGWICDGDTKLSFYKDKSFYWRQNIEKTSLTGKYKNKAEELELTRDIRGEEGGEMYNYSVVFEIDDRLVLSGNGLGNKKENLTCNREI